MSHLIYNIFHTLFYAMVDLLKSWSFIFLVIICVFNKQIKELISSLNVLKLSKDGLELQKTRETLKDLQELAITMYIPILDILAKTGRWGGAPTIEERLLNRDMIMDFMKKHDIKNSRVQQKIDGINNSILCDILNAMIDPLKTQHKLYTEIHNLFNASTSDNFVCNPDMKAIKEILIQHGLLNDAVKYIFGEIEYFISNKQFKDMAKLRTYLNADDELVNVFN